jgi:hypothetical protein
MDLSNLAWLREKCCFDCYWAGRVTESGEVNVVKFEMEGREKVHIEIPIARDELRGVLTRSCLNRDEVRMTTDMTAELPRVQNVCPVCGLFYF